MADVPAGAAGNSIRSSPLKPETFHRSGARCATANPM
jgi:hypothetical protein